MDSGSRSMLAGEGTLLVEHDAARIPSDIYLTELGRYYGFRYFHLWLFIVALIAQTPAATVIGMSPYLLESIQEEFAISNEAAAFIHTGIFIGSLPGVLLVGRLGDKFGRKATIMGCILLITTLSLLCLVIPSRQNGGFAVLIALRISMGLPYAAMLMLVTPYLIEFMSDRIRGGMAVLMGLGWSFGTIYGISMVGLFGTENWRQCFARAPFFPGILAAVAVATLPESPRWLRVARSGEQAQEALDSIFASFPVLGIAHVGKAPMVHVQETSAKQEDVWNFTGVLRALLGPHLIRITVVTSIAYAITAGCGNSLTTWGPRILELVTGTSAGLEIFKHAELVSEAVLVLTALTVDILGRRLLIGSALLGNIGAFVFLSSVTDVASAKASWLVHVGASTMLWQSLTTYMAEAFPTSLRGSASGVCMFTGRFLSVILPMCVGGLFNVMSISSILLGVAGTYVVLLMVSLFIPEETARHPTTDKCLDTADIDALRAASRPDTAREDIKSTPESAC